MRREFTKRQKAEIVHRSMNANGQIVCEGCGLVLGRKPYEIDHIIPEALIVDKARELTVKDGQLLGKQCCHRGGKTAVDQSNVARAVRRSHKHLGIKPKSRSFQKPPGYRWDWKKGGLTKAEGPR